MDKKPSNESSTKKPKKVWVIPTLSELFELNYIPMEDDMLDSESAVSEQ
jgi:hypothetical protein